MSAASGRVGWSELNWIAGGVVEQDLVAADAGDDTAPEVNAGAAELFDRRGEVGYLE